MMATVRRRFCHHHGSQTGRYTSIAGNACREWRRRRRAVDLNGTSCRSECFGLCLRCGLLLLHWAYRWPRLNWLFCLSFSLECCPVTAAASQVSAFPPVKPEIIARCGACRRRPPRLRARRHTGHVGIRAANATPASRSPPEPYLPGHVFGGCFDLLFLLYWSYR